MKDGKRKSHSGRAVRRFPVWQTKDVEVEIDVKKRRTNLEILQMDMPDPDLE